MAAPKQVDLLAAIDDLPVGEIGAFLLPAGSPPGFAVQAQGNMVFLRILQQLRQEPGVAVIRQQQVGIMALDQRPQVRQQRARGGQVKTVSFACDLDQQAPWDGMMRGDIRRQDHHAQRNGLRL